MLLHLLFNDFKLVLYVACVCELFVVAVLEFATGPIEHYQECMLLIFVHNVCPPRMASILMQVCLPSSNGFLTARAVSTSAHT